MDLLRDVRFAARLLVKDRWFTLMAVVVLALGIGANNAVFTIVNAVLLRNLPLPKPEPDHVRGDARRRRDATWASRCATSRTGRPPTRTFSGLSFIFSGSFNVGNEGLIPDLVPGCYVSANLFKTLGVSPVLGRDFAPSEDTPGAALVVLISNTALEAALRRRPRHRRANHPDRGRPRHHHRRHARGHALSVQRGYLAPDRHDAAGPHGANRGRRGAILPSAGSPTASPSSNRGPSCRSSARGWPSSIRRRTKTCGHTPIRSVERILGPQISLLFWSLMGAVGFVVLIACSNVANLLLAKAARRSGEMSVRVAVGASRWQIVRQLLVESLLLAFVAGALGLLLSIAGIRWFAAEAQNVGRAVLDGVHDGLAHVHLPAGPVPRDRRRSSAWLPRCTPRRPTSTRC